MTTDPSPAEQGDAPTTRTDPPRPGRKPIRPREWLTLGVVIGLAAGLGLGILLTRNGASADRSAAAGPATTARTTVTVTTRQAADTSSYSQTGTETAGDGDVVASAVQPNAPTTDSADGPIGPLGDMSRRAAGDPVALGDVDAPVTMVMFSDYRCPFCAKFATTLEQPLIDKYVDTGVMRIEWRDFPIFGEESMRAAVAGRAAARQGKFWEFNDAVYAAAPASGHPDLTRADLIEFAKQAGVPDIDAFTADLEDPKLAAAVQEDFDEGAALGVPATPSFVINGYPLRGAQPLAEFEKVIDRVVALQ